ncbi:MAG TPA: pitrilysin family protein, partial [Prolixibacteraceae bacterium]|nr:pitrilysin family protein [Prolixibacteraceae bacterium]
LKEMIDYKKHILKNGLRVITHTDKTTPMVAVNVAYDVGSRDEHPEKTGFAHLFEHLMFGGSVNIPNYDTPLQNVGGDNNAFTSNDITNYYLTLPAQNIETGLWLESDRMLGLAFSQKGLDIQRNVVIEEFKQRYLNQPYGDVYPLVKDLAYKVHPYRWPTIGKDISHIENATLDDVKSFFYRHYAPNNAVLTISGNIEADHAFRLAEKWFGDIPRRDVPLRNLPPEPHQNKYREKNVSREVPYHGVYLSFHMDDKLSPDYYVTDLISDILSNGQSSRMYRNLIMDSGLFGELDAYISGDNDPGLFTVAGKLINGVSIEKATQMIWQELDRMIEDRVGNTELQKVINKVEANLVYSEINYLNKAMALSAFELLGDADLINKQNQFYRNVTVEKVRETAQHLFRKENCSTLLYLKKDTND